MILIKYETPAQLVSVLVGTTDVMEAQRLAQAADSFYQRMVSFERLSGAVWLAATEVRVHAAPL